jgi:hypothetical protein
MAKAAPRGNSVGGAVLEARFLVVGFLWPPDRCHATLQGHGKLDPAFLDPEGCMRRYPEGPRAPDPLVAVAGGGDDSQKDERPLRGGFVYVGHRVKNPVFVTS